MKTWLDDLDEHPAITVELLANGTKVSEVEVNEDTDWKYEFTDLDKYDESGEAITYTIEEVEVEGYETTIDGFDITNLRVGETEVTGTKTWLDDDSENRPNSITVYLLANGEQVDEMDVTAESDWEYAFTELPNFDEEGKEIVYTVDEESIEGYEKSIEGNDITNLRVGTTEVEITKLWKDESETDRPEVIKVNLLQNGEFYEEHEVTEANDWELTITDLPEFDEEGVAYEYTIKEHDVPGYAADVDGFDITNTRTDVKSIEITKTWLDDNSDDRPDSIEVELFRSVAGGEKEHVDTITLTQEDDWSLEVADLPAFDADGKAYTYEIEEKVVEGYETSINGFELTNVRVGETEVTGSKTWLDDDSEERPESITVYLLANGEQVDEMDVTAESDWEYAFTELPNFDEEGKEIVYTVDEESIEGYEKSIEGNDITNLRVGTTEVEITKLWKDESETDRPEVIKVNLLQNGEFYEEHEVTEANDWELTITDLPEFDEEGVAYEYTIKEHDVPGYAADVDGFDITNTRTDVKSIEITKTWLDDNSDDRPDSIEVELFRSVAGGEKEHVDTITLTQEDDWSLEVADLPAFDADGKAYTYEIEEKVVEGYETSINGFELTNVRVGETEVTGSKTWLDDDSEERPESITVYLLANGEQVDEMDVTAESDREYAFTELPKYDDQGVEITYTVDEESVEGYEKSIEGNDITNLRVGTTEAEITKSWKDENETDRPDTIKVNLLQNGEFYEEYEVTKENEWELTITDLPQYDDEGVTYEYTVNEHDVPGYASDVDGFEVTNTRSDVKSIEITKTWLDDDSRNRPDSIEVELYRSVVDGEKELVDTVTITETEESEWSLEVADLPAFDADGKAYTYEIEEKAVEGYETNINGFELTNVRVGETEVTGTKTWLDDESEDRPESITVHLLANGEQVDDVEVTSESNWAYEFTELPKYDDQGVEITYTIDEADVSGYEKSIEGTDITNVRVGTTEVDITKLWNDEQETDRPDLIKVNLLQNGDFYEEYEVTKENDWKLTITDLPKYDEAGVAYEYTVKEHDVPGYATDVDGFEITNTRSDVKTIEITKTWLDDNSDDRPESIEVELFRSVAGGEKEQVDTITLTQEDDWSLEVADLPAFDADGKAYTYEIEEKAVEGYETNINGFELTNVRVGETEVTGTKTWLDDESEDRPESITVH